MDRIRTRIEMPDHKHLYELGVKKDGETFRIEVEANNRTQAAAIAKKAGYEVCDVNMVG